jgi:hypothetical protein
MLTDKDQKIIEALKSNFQHARHIEDLRLRMALAYILSTLGTGFAVIKGSGLEFQLTGCLAGLFLTIFCWIMTRKWNREFNNQIIKADKCARKLEFYDSDGINVANLHQIMGFPLPIKPSVGFLFHCFYLVYAIAWISILIIIIISRNTMNPSIT